ncbi:hypothetical protein AB0I61_32435 [Polymorphospora rubra]|uniref:hypothetical protein n=1 Tax=Polymorphospora rubra TaxID=338584 RepID=UPI0033D27D18
MIDESIHRRKRPRWMPLIAPRVLNPPNEVWSEEQWAVLQRGMYPSGMDYRWCTYAVDRRWYAHRSWTGQGIFEAEFAPTEGGWRVIAAVVESGDVNSYVSRPDRELSDLLRRVIDIAARWNVEDEYSWGDSSH